jgi:Spy/CpxP family protein refolding chaperone
MRKLSITAGVALAFVMSAGAAGAQGPRTRPDPADAAARREWIKEHRENAKAKWESLTPEQRDAFKAQMKAYEEERKSLMEQVKAGKIDRKTAAEQLKKWREDHAPKTP